MSQLKTYDFGSVWRELVTAQSDQEALSAISLICDSVGALRVSWTDRHYNLGRETSVPVLRHNHCHAPLSIESQEELEEAYLDSPLPPPDYRNPTGYYGRVLLQDNLLRYSAMPQDNPVLAFAAQYVIAKYNGQVLTVTVSRPAQD